VRVETIGDATLYLGDCMEVLPTLGRVDAVITDPPYGIGADAHHGPESSGWRQHHVRGWDETTPPAEAFEALQKAGKKCIVWGGNYFPLPPASRWLVWNKVQRGFSLADAELAWTSLGGAVRVFDLPRSPALYKQQEHPTQKPLLLMRWCIEQVGNARSILDPYMGSGTTGVACVELGLKFIGIEREPKYFDIACKRIEQAYAQGQLFAPEQPKPQQLGLEAA
jgi:site-specific DNA-methyltransferase (adenine-specific)